MSVPSVRCTAVTAAYLREPDTELPLPGHEFARRINSFLAAADRPSIWDSRPCRVSRLASAAARLARTPPRRTEEATVNVHQAEGTALRSSRQRDGCSV